MQRSEGGRVAAMKYWDMASHEFPTKDVEPVHQDCFEMNSAASKPSRPSRVPQQLRNQLLACGGYYSTLNGSGNRNPGFWKYYLNLQTKTGVCLIFFVFLGGRVPNIPLRIIRSPSIDIDNRITTCNPLGRVGPLELLVPRHSSPRDAHAVREHIE